MKILTKFTKYLFISLLLLALITALFMQQKSFGKLPSGKRLERINSSPNFRNGSFQNLTETKVMAEDASYFAMTKEFFSAGVDREPATPIPSVKTDLRSLPDNEPTIIWFGHSSYLIHIAGKNILVDPVFSQRASPVQYAGVKSYNGTMTYATEDFPDIDLLIISHDHYDHLDYNTIVRLKDKTKLFAVPLGVGSHLSYWGVDEDRIHEFDWWQRETLLSDIELIATPARHFSGRGFRRNKTLWASFVLKTKDHTIFIGGDSGYDNAFKIIGEKYGPFDIAMLECGQYDVKWPNIHMMPEEVVQASVDLRAEVLLPVHWGKFTLSVHPWREPIQRALKHAEVLQVKVTTPKIGEPVVLDSIPAARPWWDR